MNKLYVTLQRGNSMNNDITRELCESLSEDGKLILAKTIFNTNLTNILLPILNGTNIGIYEKVDKISNTIFSLDFELNNADICIKLFTKIICNEIYRLTVETSIDINFDKYLEETSESIKALCEKIIAIVKY